MTRRGARWLQAVTRSLVIAAALMLTGCAHAAGLRYTFRPCNAGFQQALRACFYEAGTHGPVVGYDFYADSGVIEKHWKSRFEGCMFRRGYNQIDNPTTWRPKERFNGATGWPWPDDPPKSVWTWVRTAGTGDRHYYDAMCEP